MDFAPALKTPLIIPCTANVQMICRRTSIQRDAWPVLRDVIAAQPMAANPVRIQPTERSSTFPVGASVPVRRSMLRWTARVQNVPSHTKKTKMGRANVLVFGHQIVRASR